MNKILVITNMYPSESNPSYGIFIKNQIDNLRKYNLEVDVVSQTIQKKGFLYSIFKYSAWVFAFLKKTILSGNKYKIIHAHYVFPSGLLGLLIKKLKKNELIVTAHGGDIHRMPYRHPIVMKLTKKILKEADSIVAVSKDLKREIHEKFDISTEKINVISMGINQDVFYPQDKREVRQKYQIEENLTLFIFVGNVIRQKGINELVEAFHMYYQYDSNCKLYIIGSLSDDVFYKEMEFLISSLGLSKYVYFFGAKSQTEVSELVNAADIFVFPSYSEGLGLVVLEAFSCGTPVISTSVGGLSEIVGNGRSEVVQVKNVGQIYDAMKKLMENQQLRVEMVQLAKVKASEYNMNTMSEKLIELYQT